MILALLALTQCANKTIRVPRHYLKFLHDPKFKSFVAKLASAADEKENGAMLKPPHKFPPHKFPPHKFPPHKLPPHKKTTNDGEEEEEGVKEVLDIVSHLATIAKDVYEIVSSNGLPESNGHRIKVDKKVHDLFKQNKIVPLIKLYLKYKAKTT